MMAVHKLVMVTVGNGCRRQISREVEPFFLLASPAF